MPRWKVRGFIGKHKLDETGLVLVTLAVCSGAHVAEALHCLHRMSDVESLAPCEDLSQWVALAGCVMRDKLLLREVIEVEKVAREQYPGWDRTKTAIKTLTQHGLDPRYGRNRFAELRTAVSGKRRFESDTSPHTQNMRGHE